MRKVILGLLFAVTCGTVTMQPRAAEAHGCPMYCDSKKHGSFVLSTIERFICWLNCHAVLSIDGALSAVNGALSMTQNTVVQANSAAVESTKAMGQTVKTGDTSSLGSDTPISEYTILNPESNTLRDLIVPYGGTQQTTAFEFLGKIDLTNPNYPAVTFIREFLIAPKEQDVHTREQIRQKRLKAYIDTVLWALAVPNYIYGQAQEQYAPAMAKVDADIKGLTMESDIIEVLRVRLAAQEMQNQLLATATEIAAAKVVLKAVENMYTTNIELPYWYIDAKQKPTEKTDDSSVDVVVQ
jgi:hypothetical protein